MKIVQSFELVQLLESATPPTGSVLRFLRRPVVLSTESIAGTGVGKRGVRRSLGLDPSHIAAKIRLHRI